MGQGDILNVLSKKNKAMTSKEIAESLNKGVRSTQLLIRKLLENNDIEKIKNGYVSMYKIKDK